MPTLESFPLPQQLLLHAIKRRITATTAELSSEAYLSANATRRHLRILTDLGLITSRTGNGKRGRPAHRFTLTPGGEAVFPEDYFEIADTLLLAARAQGDDVYEGVERALLESRMLSLGRQLAGLTGADRLIEYEAVLHREGYYPRLTELADGGYELELLHCPIVRLATRHPQLCELELAGLAEVLGPGVTRAAFRLEGGRSCTYRFHFDAVAAGA